MKRRAIAQLVMAMALVLVMAFVSRAGEPALEEQENMILANHIATGT